MPHKIDGQRGTPVPDAPTIAVTIVGERIALEGVLDIRTVAEARSAIEQRIRAHKFRALDLEKLVGLDSPGALFLCSLREKQVELTGVRAEHKALLELICGLDAKPLPKPRVIPRWRELIIGLGRSADEVWHDTLDIVSFVGWTASATVRALVHPRYLSSPRYRARSRTPASTRCRSWACSPS
jgi:ABC-type transporter Mla MlaB component